MWFQPNVSSVLFWCSWCHVLMMLNYLHRSTYRVTTVQGKICTSWTYSCSVCIVLCVNMILGVVVATRETIMLISWIICVKLCPRYHGSCVFEWQSPFLGVVKQVLAPIQTLSQTLVLLSQEAGIEEGTFVLSCDPGMICSNIYHYITMLMTESMHLIEFCWHWFALFVGVMHGCLFKNVVSVWIPRTYWECEVDT